MILCNLHYAICGAKILIIADICKGLCKIMQKRWQGCHLLRVIVYFLLDLVVCVPPSRQ